MKVQANWDSATPREPIRLLCIHSPITMSSSVATIMANSSPPECPAWRGLSSYSQPARWGYLVRQDRMCIVYVAHYQRLDRHVANNVPRPHGTPIRLCYQSV